MPDNDKKLAIANYFMGVIKLNECYSQGISKEHQKSGLTDSIKHFMDAIKLY